MSARFQIQQAPRFDFLKRWPTIVDPILHELYDILVAHNALSEFKNAIDEAISQGIEELTEVGVTAPYQYIYFLHKFLTWPPTEMSDGQWVYKHIIVFYYLFNIKPFSVNENLQTLILPENIGKPMKPVTQWLVSYANKMAEFMNTKASWSEEALRTFQNAKDYNIDWYQGPWNTFNEFFSRHLKVPRQIDGLNDDSIIVSPADSTYESPLQAVDDKSDINVKGLLWNIDELLDVQDVCKRGTFAGGKFIHSFLKPYDYHRQHAPISGIVHVAKVVQGQCYLQVEMENAPLGGRPHLKPVRPIPPPAPVLPGPPKDTFGDIEAKNLTGYQFLQTRGVIIIENEQLGYVACLPIGMAQVSSVKIEPSILPQNGQKKYVRKGDPISWFEIGGSDFIMVFQKDANVSLMLEPAPDAHMLQGQRVLKAGFAEQIRN